MRGSGRRRQRPAPARSAGDDLARLDTALARLADLLARISHPRAGEVAELQKRLAGDTADVWRTLNGNAWWGGAGSLAAETLIDNPGLDPVHWRTEIGEFRELLIEIAELLRAHGDPNPGLDSWLLAFRNWNASAV